MNGRVLFLLVFVAAAMLALWWQGDELLFGAWPAKILGMRKTSDDRGQTAEAFTDKTALHTPESDRVPLPYSSENMGLLSPAVFPDGARSNPPPPQRDPKLYGEAPPDTQRFATVLSHRARDDLWLACQTRRSSCDTVTTDNNKNKKNKDHDKKNK